MERLDLEFYYGQEAEQFTFYRLPKALITDNRFKEVSNNAKLLYGLMLDRMGLSARSGWFDEENRVFIYYSIEDIATDLHCGRNKAIKALQELDTEKGIGFVEKNRRGQGKGSILYVKNFFTEECEEQKFTNQTSEQNEGDSEVYISNFKKFKKQTSKSPKSKLLEVPYQDSKNNKYNNTNGINNDSMATVVDHIKPHRGDKKLFWDRGNWQPLCEHHHNVKTMTEDRYVEYRF